MCRSACVYVGVCVYRHTFVGVCRSMCVGVCIAGYIGMGVYVHLCIGV